MQDVSHLCNIETCIDKKCRDLSKNRDLFTASCAVSGLGHGLASIDIGLRPTPKHPATHEKKNSGTQGKNWVKQQNKSASEQSRAVGWREAKSELCAIRHSIHANMDFQHVHESCIKSCVEILSSYE